MQQDYKGVKMRLSAENLPKAVKVREEIYQVFISYRLAIVVNAKNADEAINKANKFFLQGNTSKRKSK